APPPPELPATFALSLHDALPILQDFEDRRLPGLAAADAQRLIFAPLALLRFCALRLDAWSAKTLDRHRPAQEREPERRREERLATPSTHDLLGRRPVTRRSTRSGGTDLRRRAGQQAEFHPSLLVLAPQV